MHTIGQLKQLTIFVNKPSVYYQALLLAIYYNTRFPQALFLPEPVSECHILHQIPSVDFDLLSSQNLWPSIY